VSDDERSVCEENENGWREGFAGSVRRALSHGATVRKIGRAAQEAAIQMVLTEEGGSV
jgi:hypothetical protein